MTNIANKIRRGILAYVHDHPGTDKWDVLEEVCPDRKKTGFNIMKGLINEGLIQEALQHIADHDRVTVGNVATMLMVDMEITPAQAQEIIISLVADGKVYYQPAYLEVRE